MTLRRWTVNQAVAWVATRSGQAVGRNKGSVGLTAFVAVLPGQYPIPRYNDAWLELATEMVSGAVSAVGTEIQRDKAHGNRIERLGIRFPPAEQPGLGLECFVVEEPPRTVIRPNGWLFSPRWTEYADLSFERTAVMAAFPTIDHQSPQNDAIEAPAVPDRVRTTQTSLAPSQARQPRQGSQEARVRQLIDEAFPSGIGQSTDSAIQATLRSKFKDADRNIQVHTIRRAIKAARAAELA